MGRRRDVTPFDHGRIAAYHDAGYNQVQIADICELSRRAIQNSLKNERGGRKNCGGVRKTSEADDRAMKLAITRNPTMNSEALRREMRHRGVEVSSRSIRRRLVKKFGLVARRPARKPMVTALQRRKRLAFCQRYKENSAEWWERVMFSDESTFQQVRGQGSNYIRRPVGQRLNPKYTQKTVKHPPSVMVWGAMAANGRGPLQIIPKGQSVNSKVYIDILQEKLKLHMEIRGTTIFLQDSAPCHKSKATMKWFADNRVELLDFPPNSADLNVIENLWSDMKKKVASHFPQSRDDLIDILKNVWTREMTPEYCKTLAHSMPDRIKAVIKNNGYPSKY